MGQMCSNPLEYLIEQYGQDVGKFIMVEKTKEYFDQKFPEVKKDLSSQTGDFQRKVVGEIDTQSSSCISKITATINQLKQTKKVQIEAFEKTSGKKVDELAGVSTINQKFDDIKTKSKEKLSGLEKVVLDQADQLAGKQKKKLDEMKPSLPIYENLPQCLKDKVWQEGTKKYGDKIEAEKKKTEDFFKNGLSFEELKKKFGGNLPNEELKNITSSAESNIQTLKKTISLSGGAGDMLGNVKSLF